MLEGCVHHLYDYIQKAAIANLLKCFLEAALALDTIVPK